MYGVLPRYRDSRGRQRECAVRSIYQALVALGADLDAKDGGSPDSSPDAVERLRAAIGARKQAMWTQLVDPVLVFWDGMPHITVRLPVSQQAGVEFSLVFESGLVSEWRVGRAVLEEVSRERVGRLEYAEYRVRYTPGLGGLRRGRLPHGYHRLRVTSGALQGESTVISAPRQCWAPAAAERMQWGVFAPLYGLRSDRDWGAGDLAELRQLREWVTEAGGEVVATLPLLAAYLDTPFEPAPYRPVSRLFWNEFYLAVEQTAEWHECPSARELWQSVGQRLSQLRASDLVDYAATMAIKRPVLEQLARCFFDRGGSAARRAYDRYLQLHPHVEDYAAFRAQVGSEGADWRSWGHASLGNGGIRQGPRAAQAAAVVGPPDGSDLARYHLYCQWQMDEQLGRLAAGEGAGLFLDVPVGVHPGGFDTWRWRELFVERVSSGAPPDAFFALGQRWNTSPLHPERIRERGHEYLIAYTREQMRHARYMRIDHFMAVHRLFWVPDGSDAKDGVYVTYPAEEQYAVLSLESHRNQTIVVGEDLGTVPPEVRRGMRRHGVFGTWVLQASLRPRAARPIPEPPSHDVVTINTHDMFPFAGFLRGDDIEERLQTGQVDGRGAHRELAVRRRLVARLDEWLPGSTAAGPSASPGSAGNVRAATAGVDGLALLHRLIARLAKGRPALLLLTVEDLWGETRPQNLPGSGPEKPNWRRKLARSSGDAYRAIKEIASLIQP